MDDKYTCIGDVEAVQTRIRWDWYRRLPRELGVNTGRQTRGRVEDGWATQLWIPTQKSPPQCDNADRLFDATDFATRNPSTVYSRCFGNYAYMMMMVLQHGLNLLN